MSRTIGDHLSFAEKKTKDIFIKIDIPKGWCAKKYFTFKKLGEMLK